VNIHIHDIFTPADYTFLQPEAIANIRFWNEQYLVEAMLTHSTKFEVIAALNVLKNARYDDLKSVCPYLSPTASQDRSIFASVPDRAASWAARVGRRWA